MASVNPVCRAARRFGAAPVAAGKDDGTVAGGAVAALEDVGGARFAAEDRIAVERDRDDEGVAVPGRWRAKSAARPRSSLRCSASTSAGARFCSIWVPASARALISGAVPAPTSKGDGWAVWSGRLVRCDERPRTAAPSPPPRAGSQRRASFAHRRKTPSGAAQVKPGRSVATRRLLTRNVRTC